MTEQIPRRYQAIGTVEGVLDIDGPHPTISIGKRTDSFLYPTFNIILYECK